MTSEHEDETQFADRRQSAGVRDAEAVGGPSRSDCRERIEELEGLLASSEARYVEAKRAQLVARDYVIGLEARVVGLERELVEEREHWAHVLADTVTALQRSRTWRVGRVVVAPLSRLRRPSSR